MQQLGRLATGEGQHDGLNCAAMGSPGPRSEEDKRRIGGEGSGAATLRHRPNVWTARTATHKKGKERRGVWEEEYGRIGEEGRGGEDKRRKHLNTKPMGWWQCPPPNALCAVP